MLSERRHEREGAMEFAGENIGARVLLMQTFSVNRLVSR